jgi:hypothetical protein
MESEVIIVMPAYNAVATLEKTVKDIPLFYILQKVHIVQFNLFGI